MFSNDTPRPSVTRLFVAIACLVAVALVVSFLIGQARASKGIETIEKAHAENYAELQDDLQDEKDDLMDSLADVRSLETSLSVVTSQTTEMSETIAAQAVEITKQKNLAAEWEKKYKDATKAVTPSVSMPAPPVEGAAPPVASSAPSGGSHGHAGVERWRSKVAYYFGEFGAKVIEQVLCVMSHGSTGNGENSEGVAGLVGIGGVGLLQLSADHGTLTERKDPDYNLATAARLYAKSGWGPWGVKPCATHR